MKITETLYELTDRQMYYDCTGEVKLINGIYIWYLNGDSYQHFYQSSKFGLFEYAWFNCYTWSKQELLDDPNNKPNTKFIRQVPGIMCHYCDFGELALQKQRKSPYHKNFNCDYALSEALGTQFAYISNLKKPSQEKITLSLFAIDFKDIEKRSGLFDKISNGINAFQEVQQQILENNGNCVYDIYEVED